MTVLIRSTRLVVVLGALASVLAAAAMPATALASPHTGDGPQAMGAPASARSQGPA
jgi:hypothetical protein